ncbi:uncharacterized protein [Apostichopus japonicus]|uniref:uncharacterized protein n=1 Tax=Stichopus japonicus TaxID=307972 RepID=UPI003AB25EC5
MKLGRLLLLVTLIIVFTNICCASSICDKTQEATLFTTFEVECSLPNHEWTSVVYWNESNDLIRYQKATCESSSGRTIGPRYEDGTLHITNTGVLVFNNITMSDSTNYQLEYIDCDGETYPRYTDNFYISVHNVEEPTTAQSESSTTSSHSNTPANTTSTPKDDDEPGGSAAWVMVVKVVMVVIVVIIIIILAAIFLTKTKICWTNCCTKLCCKHDYNNAAVRYDATKQKEDHE